MAVSSQSVKAEARLLLLNDEQKIVKHMQCMQKFLSRNLTLKEVDKIVTRRGCQGWMIMLREECDWCNGCFCFILKVEINRTSFKDNAKDFGKRECGLLYR